MKKRILILILCVLTIGIFLSGCGENDGTKGVEAGGDAKVEAKKEYKKGTLTAESFESEYLNMKYSLPENFIMATEEEVLQMSDLGEEVLNADLDKYDFNKANVVYEMMAVNQSEGQNILLMVEKLPFSNMKVDAYIEELKKELSSVENINYTIDEEVKSKEIAGKSYSVVSVSGMDGAMLQDYLIRIENGRIVAIIVTSSTEEDKDVMLNGFTTFK